MHEYNKCQNNNEICHYIVFLSGVEQNKRLFVHGERVKNSNKTNHCCKIAHFRASCLLIPKQQTLQTFITGETNQNLNNVNLETIIKIIKIHVDI